MAEIHAWAAGSPLPQGPHGLPVSSASRRRTSPWPSWPGYLGSAGPSRKPFKPPRGNRARPLPCPPIYRPAPAHHPRRVRSSGAHSGDKNTNTAPSNATTKPAATPHKRDCSTGKVRGRLLDSAGAAQCPRKRRNSGSTVSGSMFSRPATCSMSTSWTSSRTCHGASHSASTGWR